MRFFFFFTFTLLLQVSFLTALFSPGFLSPDLPLVLLLTKAYMRGRETVLWAVFGGAFMDILTDTLGLNLTLYTLSVYLFVLVCEKFISRDVITFTVFASGVVLLKRLIALLMMGSKYSFEVSLWVFFFSWSFEAFTLFILYFLYMRR